MKNIFQIGNDSGNNLFLSCKRVGETYIFNIIEQFPNYSLTKPFLITDDKKQAGDLYRSAKKYAHEYAFFNNLEFYKTYNSGNGFRVEIQKNKNTQISVMLKDENDILCGFKKVNLSPFETFLILNQITFNGEARLQKEYIGKGFGKIMYSHMDDILKTIYSDKDFSMIPDGYALAPGYLSLDGQHYWKKRLQFTSIPEINVNMLDAIKKNQTINSYLYMDSEHIFHWNSTQSLISVIMSSAMINSECQNEILYHISDKENNVEIFTQFPDFYKSDTMSINEISPQNAMDIILPKILTTFSNMDDWIKTNQDTIQSMSQTLNLDVTDTIQEIKEISKKYEHNFKALNFG